MAPKLQGCSTVERTVVSQSKIGYYWKDGRKGIDAQATSHVHCTQNMESSRVWVLHTSLMNVLFYEILSTKSL